MTKPLAKWIQKRYALLWNQFKGKELTHKEISKFLKVGEQQVSVFLSDLKNAGWVNVTLSQKDTRKRVYKLKSPQDAFKEMASK